jgi:molecular chaperone GrpE
MSDEQDIKIQDDANGADEPSDAELDALAEELTTDDEEVEVLAGLEAQLEAAKQEAQTNLDGWQRAQAEFQNYKRRMERDSESQRELITGRVAKRYLEIVDDLDRALNNRPTDKEGAEWAEGVELVYRKLLAILDSEGVKVMDALGQPFDPNLHEAIGEEESDEHGSGTVLEVLQKGYWIGERVLRPALVKVAA